MMYHKVMSYSLKSSILSFALGITFSVSSLASTTHSFIKDGEPVDINQCGKFFGEVGKDESWLTYKSKVSSSVILGGRHLDGGNYKISVTLAPDSSGRLFLGGRYIKGFMVNYKSFVHVHEGMISGKGELAFKPQEIKGPIKLNLISDGATVKLTANGKVLCESSSEGIVAGGYFGLRQVGGNELRINDFTLEASNSIDTKPQAYRPMNRLHQEYWTSVHNASMEKKKCDILFVGDSITDAFDGHCSFTKSPDRLGSEAWSKMTAGKVAVNAGIGSDRTQHVLWRVQQLPLDVMQPQYIVLLIGINNLGSGHSPEDVSQGIKEIVKELKYRAPESEIIVQGIFPLRRTKNLQTLRDRITVNADLEKTHWGKNVTFINLDSVMLDDKGLLKDGYSYDGCHLTKMGFSVWAEAISSELNK